ncbi:hypothetical protein [Streptomyces sp. NRRL WC-3549]|uniref:hypothetical protein n=1 Tax=Streptomyces sp. NRRL WC-3549 TaxID=1463925 RepID=UPI0004CB8D39|nr:hypothetical protein [Streptomyces sp. NRRL WC-3549]
MGTDDGPPGGLRPDEHPLRPSPAVAATAARLTRLSGVEAVALGRSRARRTDRPECDRDLDPYHRAPRIR